MEKNNKPIIFIILLVAIVLIGGGWFVFSKSAEFTSDFDSEKIKQEVDAVKIKILAQENLEFFPLANSNSDAIDIFKQFQENPQYKKLDVISTYVNLTYNSNRYPFRILEELMPEESEEE
ncbi:hypothetical protein HOD19_03385 [bacterium]|jgi:uncharacterized membrane protein|nr:hypothetical protein [bacterium]MBT4649319.1 hypothetical protein [bacterium]